MATTLVEKLTGKAKATDNTLAHWNTDPELVAAETMLSELVKADGKVKAAVADARRQEDVARASLRESRALLRAGGGSESAVSKAQGKLTEREADAEEAEGRLLLHEKALSEARAGLPAIRDAAQARCKARLRAAYREAVRALYSALVVARHASAKVDEIHAASEIAFPWGSDQAKVNGHCAGLANYSLGFRGLRRDPYATNGGILGSWLNDARTCCGENLLVGLEEK